MAKPHAMKRAALPAVVLLAVVPYLGALRAPLLYDDRTALDSTWLAREAGPGSVFRHDFWYGTTAPASDLYRPLTVLSLAWNLRLAPSRMGIRIVNIAAHAGAALALFFLLSLMVERGAAWIGAALFAVHPLGSEAVLWAVGRAEIFAMIFGTLAFVLFVRAGERDEGAWGALLGSAAALLVALFFKESAAAWILVGAAWIALAPHGRRPGRRALARQAIVALTTFGVYCVVRGAAVGWGRQAVPWIDNPLARLDPAARAVNALLLFGRYLGKMVWPATLSVDYGYDQIPVVTLWPWIVPAAALAVATVTGVLLLRRKGGDAAAFLLAFVPSAFAVTGNIAFPIGTNFAERLAYTPLAGFCGLAALGLAAIPRPSLRAIAVAAVLLAGAARTAVRTADYSSLVALNEATATASPRAVKALANAGRTRLRTGDAGGARPLLERAVTIWPDYPRGWQLLADACQAEGDAPCASEARERARTAAAKNSEGPGPL